MFMFNAQKAPPAACAAGGAFNTSALWARSNDDLRQHVWMRGARIHVLAWRIKLELRRSARLDIASIKSLVQSRGGVHRRTGIAPRHGRAGRHRDVVLPERVIHDLDVVGGSRRVA